MVTGYIIMVIAIVLVVLVVGCGLGYWGIKLCMKNNPIGLLPLVIGLNIIGLGIGIWILHSNKSKNNSPVKEIKNVEITKEEE